VAWRGLPLPLPLPLPFPLRIPEALNRRDPSDPRLADDGSAPLARAGATSGAPAALCTPPGADPRTALLAALIHGEVTAAAAGDVEVANIVHDAATKLLTLISGGDKAIDAARAAHGAVGKLLIAMAAGARSGRRSRR
jgi:hypothetical protein